MNKRFLLYTLLAIPCLVISSYPILKKYSSVELSDSNIVLFESKDFNDDENMYFKIKTYEEGFSDYYIDFKYFNSEAETYEYSNTDDFKRADFDSNTESSADISNIYASRFFYITKSSDDYSSYYETNGNYILMKLHLKVPSGETKLWAIIENTQNNESNSSSTSATIYTVVIVVICILIVGIPLIICFCKSNKRETETNETHNIPRLEENNFQMNNPLPYSVRRSGLPFPTPYPYPNPLAPTINEQIYPIENFQSRNDWTSQRTLNLNKSFNNKEKPFSFIINSVDGTVHFSVIGYESKYFREIEEELFKEYPNLKTKNIIYLHEGAIIDKNKTLKENKIKNNSNIVINFNE